MKESPEDITFTLDYEVIKSNGQKIFRCRHLNCKKEFRFKSKALRHSVVHQTDRQHVCYFPGCEKSFKRHDALINHLKLHEIREMSDPSMSNLQNFSETSSIRTQINPHFSESNNDSSLEQQPYYNSEVVEYPCLSVENNFMKQVENQEVPYSNQFRVTSQMIEMAKFENRILQEKIRLNELAIQALIKDKGVCSYMMYNVDR